MKCSSSRLILFHCTREVFEDPTNSCRLIYLLRIDEIVPPKQSKTKRVFIRFLSASRDKAFYAHTMVFRVNSLGTGTHWNSMFTVRLMSDLRNEITTSTHYFCAPQAQYVQGDFTLSTVILYSE